MVQSKQEVYQVIKNHQSSIQSFGAERLGIFGSFVRGEQNEGSDIDILVEFKEGKKTFRNYLNLADYLEILLNRKVDLLTWESLASFVQRNVKEEIEYVTFAD
ncbi:nucleotidyltransferase family protein [Dyadobacter crusticola]|uniref:nucleotidyltransferase family protein n=1 Tax=Dyadobacter crusticola TaxID=292407 RepID=UPI0004E10FD2|nr:nucleotidyltransferase family protein [Dyadobacter crusticola]